MQKVSRTTAFVLRLILSKDNQGPLVYSKVDDPCRYGAHDAGRCAVIALVASSQVRLSVE